MKYVDLKLALSPKLILATTGGKTLRVVELFARLQKKLGHQDHATNIDSIHLWDHDVNNKNLWKTNSVDVFGQFKFRLSEQEGKVVCKTPVQKLSRSVSFVRKNGLPCLP